MSAPSDRLQRSGLLYALAAYLSWGLSPLYFRAVRAAPALEIVSHRVVWSVLVLAGLALAAGRLGALRAEAFGSWRRVGAYALTTALIGFNWLLFIWATNHGRLLEASLGYFINPLVNVVLGVLFLRERLSRRQGAAVGLAAVAVGLLVVNHGRFPALSLALAVSFGVYGLVRKHFRMDPVLGLLAETLLVAPLALGFLGYLGLRGEAHFGGGWGFSLLLAAAGVITALPLVWFTHGVRLLELSTLGLLQYVSPTCQFLLAVGLYGEPFTRAHALTFGLIWLSLALFTLDLVWQARGNARSLAREARPGGAA